MKSSLIKSREGNPVPAQNALIRTQIMGNSNSLCGYCAHVLDGCANISRLSNANNGYQQIYSCNGFEGVKNNNRG